MRDAKLRAPAPHDTTALCNCRHLHRRDTAHGKCIGVVAQRYSSRRPKSSLVFYTCIHLETWCEKYREIKVRTFEIQNCGL